MRFISFASSSKGNCTLISYKNTNILVDCGLSKKRIVENLLRYNLTLDDIDCIFITHEHSDHIQGLPIILKEHDIKIVSQRETLKKILDLLEEKEIKPNLDNFKIISPVNVLNENSLFEVKDIKFYPLKGCHDVPSLYYKFILGDTKIAIMTDLGKYNQYNIMTLSDVNYLMLECNYDKQMLIDGNYSPQLKLRVSGEGGHLSNIDCSEIIMKIANKSLVDVYLSHISDQNNSEEYAYEFVTKYIKENYNGSNNLPTIKLAKRLEVTEILNNEF